MSRGLFVPISSLLLLPDSIAWPLIDIGHSFGTPSLFSICGSITNVRIFWVGKADISNLPVAWLRNDIAWLQVQRNAITPSLVSFNEVLELFGFPLKGCCNVQFKWDISWNGKKRAALGILVFGIPLDTVFSPDSALCGDVLPLRARNPRAPT